MISAFETHFHELGFKKQTAIQEAVYEPLKKGHSVLGLAPTGSGKTLAFLIPLLERIVPRAGVQLVVLSPSQELAMQTSRVARSWAQIVGLRVQSLTGGANLRRQVKRLRTHPEVIVGTPGRVLHLIDNGHLKLSHARAIVIDEADDLLADDTMAVVEDIERAAPMSAQLAFFAATTSPVLKQLPFMFGRDVATFDVRDTDHSRGPVTHALMTARTNSQKTALLKKLRSTRDFRALVFFNSTRTLNYAASRLKHEHVAVATLGGRERQTKREAAMRKFRKRQIRLLLTTDVAARGLDIAKLPAVVNFDLPEKEDVYVHRAGRTGRQGERGLVINFGDDHDFRNLKKTVANLKLELVPIYIDGRTLTKNKPTAEAEKPKIHHARPGSVDADVTKHVEHLFDAKTSNHRKRRHKKNRKNKGIRLRHRREHQK